MPDFLSFFSNYWLNWLAYLLYAATIVSCIIVVISDNRNPIRSLAWVIALIALPFVGLIFYLFFGRGLKGKRLVSRRNKRKLLNSRKSTPAPLRSLNLSESQLNLSKLCYNLVSSPVCINNDITVFTDGQSKFDALIKDIKAARESILMQYYIFNDDNLGNHIADLLIEKARQGVAVRVLYDHVGSFSTKNSFFRRMSENGIEVHPFFKVTFPQLANRINWRNHNKIVVIDNKISYIGGMNIADRYNLPPEKALQWRDTHFRMEGEITEQLFYRFLLDWNFQNPSPRKISFSPTSGNISNNTGIQLIWGGPTEQYYNIALAFLKAIANAKKSIYIQTPYFLPTDALYHALEAAALAKVDVRIMIPGKSDSRMLQLASNSYVKACLKAGIKIYFYNPGMLHAKTIIIDEDIVSAGSTNFDFRSFENNFESNIIVYDREFNRRMRDIFFEDIKHCTRPTLTQWSARPLTKRIIESIVRLMAPVL